MKKRNGIFYLVWLIVLVIFQPTFIQGIKILGVSPDIFLIFVILTGLFKGKDEGAIVGYIFGFMFDMIVGRLVGLSGIIYMFAGFFAGIIKERFISDRLMIAVLVMFSSALIGGIVYYIGYCISSGGLGFGAAFIGTILPKTIYTVIVGVVLFFPIRKCFGLIEDRML